MPLRAKPFQQMYGVLQNPGVIWNDNGVHNMDDIFLKMHFTKSLTCPTLLLSEKGWGRIEHLPNSHLYKLFLAFQL